jgi:cytochrome c peroxidase
MMRTKDKLIVLLFSATVSVFEAYEIGLTSDGQQIQSESIVSRRVVRGIPQSLFSKNIGRKNLMTADKVALGEKLYFDKRLSADGTVSCATCHDPAAAFTGKDALAIGVKNHIGARNAPTLLNARFSASYFWDGRARTLEEQATQPLLNPAEMGMESEAALVARLSSITEYPGRFRRVFPREGITLKTVARAIAAYERTLLSGNAPFDRFIAGDHKAITENQKTGWELFKGKAKCIECHAFSASSPLFTDFKFYNTGVAGPGQGFENIAKGARGMSATSPQASDLGLLAHRPEYSKLGRFLVTRQPKDIGAFKTPSLRDVELTGPYMHNGSIKTLMDVVRFYNQGAVKDPQVDEKMRPLGLTEGEMSSLIEFLRALTSDDVLRLAQSSKPQTRVPVLLPHLRAAKKRSLGH